MVLNAAAIKKQVIEEKCLTNFTEIFTRKRHIFLNFTVTEQTSCFYYELYFNVF